MKYVQLGAMSLDDVASSFGDSAVNILRRKAQNIADAKQVAEEFGVGDYRELFNQLNTSASANFADLIGFAPQEKQTGKPTDREQTTEE